MIDFIRQQLGDAGFVAYCRGNAIKYEARADKKGAESQDHAKAAFYAQMAAHAIKTEAYPDPRQS